MEIKSEKELIALIQNINESIFMTSKKITIIEERLGKIEETIKRLLELQK